MANLRHALLGLLYLTTCIRAAPQGKEPEELDYVDSCQENGSFADSKQCDKYFICKNGEASEQLCDDGLVFDEKTQKCGYPHKVDCSGRELLQRATNTTDCPRANGYFAHPDPAVCNAFHFCEGGKANLVDCPGGLIFTTEKGECDWPANTNRQGCSTEDKTKPKCPKGASSPFEQPRYPDPEDCQKFFICINGDMRHSGCTEAPELIFNPDKLVCDRQENVAGDCGKWFTEEELEKLVAPVRSNRDRLKTRPAADTKIAEGEERRTN